MSVGAAGPAEGTPGAGRDLAAFVERWAHRCPDAPAVEFESHAWTYAQFATRVAATAVALAERGVVEGDRVAWLGPNRPTALELLLACSRLGAILLPLNSRLAVPEHAWILDDAEPRLLLCDEEFAGHAAAAAAACGRAAECETVPPVEPLGGATAPAPRAGTPGHAVLLAYTSGTTGRPKGAVLTQSALLANAVNSTHAHDLTRHDRVLTVIPLFHVGGLNIQTVPALLGGAAVLIHRAFDPGLFLDDVARWQPTWTVLVPAALSAVSAHPGFDEADLTSLRGVMTGSSPVPAAATKPFTERGVGVGEIYGATETAPICVHRRADEATDRPGTCGKPSTLCEVRLVPTAGSTAGGAAPTAAGAPAEIWVRGPSVMREYWRNPAATAAALVDGWYRTGDLAHADADGWLYLDDRLTDLVVSGGENVYPAEIEEQLADCGLLAEAAVIGRPDDRWGEVPIVIAVAADGSAAGTAEESAAVLDHLRGRLARFKIPAEVLWTDALPRTALGKVRKAVLRERFAR
ncbi:MAG TPA: hypothetical protein DEP66_02555 [Acidimicrobiaceae bacterium]|nr:hypothetical protein [Acidimicrobiaceae bacterium]HCB37105.1 hypothetical protein [Acidimicrobiaceae bacterium]